MNILITPNVGKENAEECTRQVAAKLLELGCTPCLETCYQALAGPGIRLGTLPELLKQCQMLLTIGGDGTIIHGAMLALEHDLPILGINTGRLGFLTQLESSQLDGLAHLAKGEYTLQERMLLQVQIYQEGALIHDRYALNDVVVSRLAMGRLLDFSVGCNGRPFTQYRADGLIFSTPTGSTAYSLSAGGSVVDPSIESILMTPICPHSLFDRSIVLSPQKTLTVSTFELNNPAEAAVAVDGEVLCSLSKGDWVQVKCGQKKAKFIILPSTADFYEVLTQKMMQRSFLPEWVNERMNTQGMVMDK